MIIDDNWKKYVAELVAEQMTFHLMDAANPQSKNDTCGCLQCLANLAVEIVLSELRENSETEMLKDVHYKNVNDNNVN